MRNPDFADNTRATAAADLYASNWGERGAAWASLYIRVLCIYIYIYIYTGWGGQSWTIFFFQSIGSHVLLKFILGLKSNGKVVLGCWLTIYSVLTLFFLATA
jgi:hypothetical protein